jgi:hypothetical protein
MGFPTWTLWGMGLAGFGALAAIALALLAQSPRLLARLNLSGQRLDRRAKTLTGYGLALLLLAMGFFLAGVPLGEGGGATVVEAGSDGFSISVLSPGPGRAFTAQDAINFDWFWPMLPEDGERFVVYLSDGEQEYALGSLDEPNNGAAYRLSLSGGELPAVGESVTWQVRLETGDGQTVVASDTIPLAVHLAETTPGPNGSQSGAMSGLPAAGGASGAMTGLGAEATLDPGTVISGTTELTLPPGATTGEPPPADSIAPSETPEPTATLAPTSTPTLTPSPTPTATPILVPTARIGDETSTLPVRRSPAGPVLVVLVRGDTVIPLTGRAFHSGEVWREVSTVDGVIGWVQDRFLEYGE